MPTSLQAMYPTMFPKEKDYGYGKRPDGTFKGPGFLGPLKRPDGGVMTEYSVGVEIDGKQMDIPTLVPSLTKKELDLLLRIKDGERIPDSIIDKAVKHAEERLKQGKGAFFGPDDEAAKP